VNMVERMPCAVSAVGVSTFFSAVLGLALSYNIITKSNLMGYLFDGLGITVILWTKELFKLLVDDISS
jgi:hypothetical protein